MGFKKIESQIGFAELALASSMDKNRTLNTLEQMNKVVDWSRIEKILKKYYKVGTSAEGADAYPPLKPLQNNHFCSISSPAPWNA
jgi:hypothetical protein